MLQQSFVKESLKQKNCFQAFPNKIIMVKKSSRFSSNKNMKIFAGVLLVLFIIWMLSWSMGII